MKPIRWVVSHVIAAFKWVLKVLGELYQLVMHVITWWVAWVIATVAYLIDLLFGWIGDLVSDVMEQVVSISIGDLPVSNLAHWLARDVVALDVAWTSFSVYFSLWVACRLARGGWMGVRCILDLL